MNVWSAIPSPGASPLGLLPLLLLLSSYRVLLTRADNLALLSGTLRTYQRSGCDDNVVTLRCPPGTSISIELAQYGSSGPSKALCGGGSSTEATDAASKTGDNTNISCLLSNAMQTKWEEVAQGTWGRYSLLQTVVETCQKKPQCKFQTSPKTFGGDPCPGVRKYVEVAYKCRPYEFRSKIACENEKIQLKCNPNSRVAVYSASYGRTEYESIQCPQAQGVSEETCLVSYATETVMQICHGKRSCELSADATTFGNPCQPKSRMYLKVVYTCVPRKVLKDQYEGRLEPDELQSEFNAYDDDFDYEHYDTAGNEFIRESAASPPASSANDRNDAAGSDGAANNLTRDSSVTSAKMPPHTKSIEGDKAHTSIPSSTSPTLPIPIRSSSSPLPPIRSRRPNHLHSRRGHRRRNRNHPSAVPPRFRYFHCCMTYSYPYTTRAPSTGPSSPTPTDHHHQAIATARTSEPDLICNVNSVTERSRVIGFISNWINTYAYLSQNRERFYLYLTVSVGSGVLLCLLMLVIRLLIQRHRDKRDAKFHVTNITDNAIPNGFADDISEVDADIDLTTPLPVPSTMAAIAIHSPGTGTIGETFRRAYRQSQPQLQLQLQPPHTPHHIHQQHHHLHSTATMMAHEAPRALTANTQYYYG